MKKSQSKKAARLISPGSGLDYNLLDSGNRRKLERFGKLILNRPEPSAIWNTSISKQKWDNADWYFYEERGKKGDWRSKNKSSTEWEIAFQYKEISCLFKLNLTQFKHLGLFPEQAANWIYVYDQIKRMEQAEVKVLNLFAYTGALSTIASAAGAKVTHVDAVKQIVDWAKSNAKKNNQENIRWIIEDCRKFVEKEIRRGEKYHGIILDPPAFGRGAKGEAWKLVDNLSDFITAVLQLLNPKEHFFVLNTYSPKLNLIQLKELLKNTKRFPQHFESGNLGLKDQNNRDLPLGNLVRFYR